MKLVLLRLGAEEGARFPLRTRHDHHRITALLSNDLPVAVAAYKASSWVGRHPVDSGLERSTVPRTTTARSRADVEASPSDRFRQVGKLLVANAEQLGSASVREFPLS